MLKPQVLAAAILLSCITANSQNYPFQDKSLSPEERADDLISRLTLEEKSSLVMNASPAIERLGIKAYDWWNEALHGVGRNGSATTFPQPIGMAASFDDALLYEVFTAVSDEARVKHRIADAQGPLERYQGLTFWTPNINLFRDPRWGRGMETYGEDPYLTGKMGSAVVRGLQGPDDSPVRKLHACAKHLAVHSGPEPSRHRFDARPSRRDLHESYLPAFKELVTKAGVEEIMTAYNRFEGVPCSANDYLLDSILRGRWGFKGMIVSDCWAVADFYVRGRHEFVEDRATAAALAVQHGVALECGDAYAGIPEAIERSLLSEAELDRNLKQVIVGRIRLGEFDGVDPWEHLPEDIVEGPEHRALALKMARESMVLLQNNGILPLAEGTPVALMGPNADDLTMMWGNYNPIPIHGTTLLSALKERLGDVKFVKGCNHVVGAEELSKVLEELGDIETVIFASGITPYLEGEQGDAGGFPGFEAGDRTRIELPQVQKDLIAALKDAGKKVVLVNFSGSAMALTDEVESCEAILQAWYPGQEGGNAIADVLYGDYNPGGKLPVTFYRSTEQLPAFESYDMAGRTYRFFEGDVLFPFGYGLSYSRFKLGRVKVVRERGGSAGSGVSGRGDAVVSEGLAGGERSAGSGRGSSKKLVVKVRNCGAMDGEEVVQVYVSHPADADGPVRTLRAFKRVFIPAGKSVKVEFPLNDDTFLWWNAEAEDMLPTPGRYVLQIGTSSAPKDLKRKRVRY